MILSGYLNFNCISDSSEVLFRAHSAHPKLSPTAEQNMPITSACYSHRRARTTDT